MGMTDKPDPAPKSNPAQAARQARLNAALRANLKRRKAAEAPQNEAETADETSPEV
jgi:hypothetical protein